MATVHLGRAVGSAGFEKKVAIKVIHPHLSDEPDLVGMFLDEARLAAGIHHPNVVETLDLGEADGVYYTVMELVEGDTLSALMKSIRPDHLPVPVVLQILSDVCDGLAAAHDLRDEHGEVRGLVHRDISPQNLLITMDGWVKISDFGIAKAAGKSHNTRPGELRGKLSYMSPEQARGEPVDHRTDIFALGIVFWELLTGERLFRGDSDAAIIDKVVRCKVPPVTDLRGDSLASVPEEVFVGIQAILTRALSARPDDRFSSAKEMAAEIRTLRRKCADQFEPRAWLADTMHERFGSRTNYLRAMLRDTGAYTPVPPEPAANETGARRGRRRTNRTGLDDVARAAARAAAVHADPGDATTDLGSLMSSSSDAHGRSPTGSLPALSGTSSAMAPAHGVSTTASHTVPSTFAGRMRVLGTWLLLPMIGAGIAITVMSRRGGDEPTDQTAPASLQADAGAGGAAVADEDTVQWLFSSDPDGATVTVDGVRQPETTPTQVSLPRGEASVVVVIEKPGYRPRTAKLTPNSNQKLYYGLEPLPALGGDVDGGAQAGVMVPPGVEVDTLEEGEAPKVRDPKRLILRRPKKKADAGPDEADEGASDGLMPMPDFDESP